MGDVTDRKLDLDKLINNLYSLRKLLLYMYYIYRLTIDTKNTLVPQGQAYQYLKTPNFDLVGILDRISQ